MSHTGFMLQPKKPFKQARRNQFCFIISAAKAWILHICCLLCIITNDANMSDAVLHVAHWGQCTLQGQCHCCSGSFLLRFFQSSLTKKTAKLQRHQTTNACHLSGRLKFATAARENLARNSHYQVICCAGNVGPQRSLKV